MANVERLKKLRETVLDNANRFNYLNWVWHPPTRFTCVNVAGLRYIFNKHPCETICCVAGWVSVLADRDKTFCPSDARASIRDVAQRYLVLSKGEADFLFVGASTERAKCEYLGYSLNLILSEAKHEDAIERIDALINYYSKAGH